MSDVINTCATYGLQGICLGMMFYLCVVTIRANTRAIINLERTLFRKELLDVKVLQEKEQCQVSGKQ